MNTPQIDNHLPPDEERVYTESLNSIDLYDDDPGDTTVRPAGPEFPRDWPRPQLPPWQQPPQPEKP